MMLEELQRRSYAQNTIRHYIRAVEDFARRFRCSPDRLGLRHIREYQAELFQKRKLSANSVGQHLAALRFFYIKTLRRACPCLAIEMRSGVERRTGIRRKK
jgi:site-specific recombinase XerD